MIITHPDDLLQADVPQIGVGNIAHEDPANFKDTLPLVRRPDSAAPCVVHL